MSLPAATIACRCGATAIRQPQQEPGAVCRVMQEADLLKYVVQGVLRVLLAREAPTMQLADLRAQHSPIYSAGYSMSLQLPCDRHHAADDVLNAAYLLPQLNVKIDCSNDVNDV
jgi:hypothetical protein